MASTAATTVQDTQYNPQGLVARRSHWYALGTESPVWSDYQYDTLGRVVQESRPDSAASGGVATTTTAYSALTTTVANPLGQTKTTTRNAQGLVSSITDALGSTLAYSYDAAGNLTQTNAAGSTTAMQYDLRGRKVAMQDAAMGSWTYRYNAFDELVGQSDSLGQSTTIAYDALGRMTQRSEPDLVSQWSHDQNFDASPCGKGIGKLCQAKTDNGYQRSHSYDSLGRNHQTSTALDNPASPAVVSETFDANTGRVASKTWPSGYQASYTYSARGYLSSVDGGGTNGFTQTTRYQILAMNAQGQITQYKLGGKVTTVKNIDAATNRLLAQSATTDGQSSGNVLSQSYSYDALSNLKSRVDNTAGVNTQENFSYDSLNRLSLATLLGGAVSPPQTIEILYDARGNIAYKSDVGRYWYDSARPNRMTNVTLERAPGATVTLTGTRQLSYAFDDYSAGAQSLNGVTVGNGNLSYTVTHDTVNARHFVRHESYTSFNMPQSIGYANFAANTSTCPQGYTLSGGVCTLTSASTTAATPVYSCPAGQTLSGTTCTLSTTSAATPNYSCPAGYTLSTTTCSRTTTVAATPVFGCTRGIYTGDYCLSGWNSGADAWDVEIVGYSCPSSYTLSGSTCSQTLTQSASIAGYTCPSGQVLSGTTCTLTTLSNAAPYPATPVYKCLSGYTLNGNNCTKVNTASATPIMGCPPGYSVLAYDEGPSCVLGRYPHEYGWTGLIVTGYTCPAGYTLSGTTCGQTLTQSASIASYTCPSGRNLVGTGCVLSGATFVGYACPNGGTLNANTCTETRTLQTAPGSANAADRTLSFVYGPEHQRIKQNVNLSGNGTSAYFAGNTWYMNGEDSLGLSYEKEVRANGTTEHKHYIAAAGAVFAIVTTREGSLNGLAPSSTSYLHKDHLGSIAAITDENGTVVERLAYDPWGKRRFINTNPGPEIRHHFAQISGFSPRRANEFKHLRRFSG